MQTKFLLFLLLLFAARSKSELPAHDANIELAENAESHLNVRIPRSPQSLTVYNELQHNDLRRHNILHHSEVRQNELEHSDLQPHYDYYNYNRGGLHGVGYYVRPPVVAAIPAAEYRSWPAKTFVASSSIHSPQFVQQPQNGWLPQMASQHNGYHYMRPVHKPFLYPCRHYPQNSLDAPIYNRVTPSPPVIISTIATPTATPKTTSQIPSIRVTTPAVRVTRPPVRVPTIIPTSPPVQVTSVPIPTTTIPTTTTQTTTTTLATNLQPSQITDQPLLILPDTTTTTTSTPITTSTTEDPIVTTDPNSLLFDIDLRFDTN